MEIRRVIAFIVLSVAVLFLWKTFVVDPMERQRQAAAELKEQKKKKPTEKQPAGANPTAESPVAKPVRELGPLVVVEEGPAVAQKMVVAEPPVPPVPPVVGGEPGGNDQTDDGAEPTPVELPKHPEKTVFIGAKDTDSGFFMEVELLSQGAGVAHIRLNDDRYHSLDEPEEPLSLVNPIETSRGADKELLRTFSLRVPAIEELPGVGSLAEANWEVVSAEQDAVTFAIEVPGRLRIEKKYSLKKFDPQAQPDIPADEATDLYSAGYQLRLDVSLQNLMATPQTVQYQLTGPVGFPVEIPDTARKLRDIRLGFRKDGEISHDSLAVDTLVGTPEEKVEAWTQPFRYVGVDGQFFAALVIPGSEELTTDYVSTYQPFVVSRDPDKDRLSEVSIRLTSTEVELPAKDDKASSVTHNWGLYAGPKRQALLEPIAADKVIDFGWFSWISKGMLAILTFLHKNLWLPYGLAIVGLTIIVRGALFPLSKKQAISAARMKELQPKLAELKKKYGDDREKFARAQMNLFREAGYNPFAGCLPMLLQLPIFIGLYNALSAAVDLRARSFLWVSNLAAPDHLFPLPFNIPFIGSWFNLLPIVTIVLFIVQQKMFMPEPSPDDEAAVMQHKMMKYMMIFMGFLFYHVPAGLCIYFIASSLWGVGERKLLDMRKDVYTAKAAEKNAKQKDKKPGLWSKLTAMTEQIEEQTNRAREEKSRGNNNGTGKKNKRSKNRR